MMRPALALILVSLLMAPMHSQSPSVLNSLRDKNRVLLVFGSMKERCVQEQWMQLADHRKDAEERDLVTIVPGPSPANAAGVEDALRVYMSANEEQSLRSRFHVAPKLFAVILIGKDGGEKLRADHPISWETLQSTIDAMPMRRSEMNRLK